jgi:uncharacterized RmlC-like cupin family protein
MSLSRRSFPFVAAAPLFAAEDPATLLWRPQDIVWQRTDPDGTKYAILDGDREKPGAPFTYAFWMPDGAWVGAHHHSQQAHVAVVQGTLLLGFGRKMDKAKTKAIQAGEFFIVRPGVPHFEGARGETLIIGSALGGWRTTTLE